MDEDRSKGKYLLRSQAGFGPNPVVLLGLPGWVVLFGFGGFNLFTAGMGYVGIFVGTIVGIFVWLEFEDAVIPLACLVLYFALRNWSHGVAIGALYLACTGSLIWSIVVKFLKTD